MLLETIKYGCGLINFDKHCVRPVCRNVSSFCGSFVQNMRQNAQICASGKTLPLRVEGRGFHPWPRHSKNHGIILPWLALSIWENVWLCSFLQPHSINEMDSIWNERSREIILIDSFTIDLNKLKLSLTKPGKSLLTIPFPALVDPSHPAPLLVPVPAS